MRSMALCFVPGDAHARIGSWLTTTPQPNPTNQHPLRGQDAPANSLATQGYCEPASIGYNPTSRALLQALQADRMTALNQALMRLKFRQDHYVF